LWLFDEADARYQVDDVTVSPSPTFMIGAEDCSEEDVPALSVVPDILETELSPVAVAFDTEDGTWMVVVAITA
jgi:hypothetical protein